MKMRALTTTTISLSLLLFASCGANEGILRSGKETPVEVNSTPKPSALSDDVEAMRTAGFTFIYVLRRKDGGKLDAEDRGVIRAQTADVNRRVVSDEDRAVLIGSNYQIPPPNMMVLYGRFAVDNYSPPPPSVDANSNANK